MAKKYGYPIKFQETKVVYLPQKSFNGKRVENECEIRVHKNFTYHALLNENYIIKTYTYAVSKVKKDN